jgi:bifunctional non-homologous end joining protein LigD
MPNIVRSIHLFFRKNGSDKVYELSIVGNDQTFDVIAHWGKRGNALQRTVKKADLSLEEATKVYDKLVAKQIKEGYDVTGNAPAATLTAVGDRDGQRSNMPIQLLNFVDGDELDALLDNPEWCGLEKFDGERRGAVIAADGTAIGVNRLGLFVPLVSNLVHALSLLPNDTILDAELIGETLYAFDALRYGGEDLTAYGFTDRHDAVADDIVARLEGTPGIVVARYTFDTRGLLERLRAENAEGIVLRRARAPHSAGRPASGGTARKYKFYETATCEVLGQNDDRRSVALSVYDGDRGIEIGNVTIPANHNIPQPGSLVEIRYLYAYPNGGSLYQPVYLGMRSDVIRADATYAQLKFRREPAEPPCTV